MGGERIEATGWLILAALASALGACTAGSDKADEDTGEPPPQPWYYVEIRDARYAGSGRYPYVEFRDTSPNALGGLRDPGTDIYKVRLVREDGLKEWAGFVLDSYIGELNNDYIDPDQILGSGSLDCEDGFVALGADGWVRFGFGSNSSPVEIFPGDKVQVHTIEVSDCDEHDPDTSYTLWMSRGEDPSGFVEVEAKSLDDHDPRKFVAPE